MLGTNGSGKSTFLKALAAREVPIPEHIDIFLLNEEFAKTEMTAVEAVVEEARNEMKVRAHLIDSTEKIIFLTFVSGWKSNWIR